MQVEIYADVMFIINLAMDFFILFITGKIFHKKNNLLRVASGAAVSAALYCILIFAVPFNIWFNVISSVCIISCGILVSFYPVAKMEFIKLLLATYSVAFAIGGCGTVIMYYTSIPEAIGNAARITLQNVSLKVLIASVCVSYAGLRLITGIVQKYSLQKQVFYRFYIYLAGKKVEITGLVDTGNSLIEPISGYPVIITEYVTLKEILPENIFLMFENKTDDDLQTILDRFSGSVLTNRIRFVPYSALGEKNGLLIGFRPDKVEIIRKKKTELKKDVIIGICNLKLSADGDYDALINPMLVKGNL